MSATDDPTPPIVLQVHGTLGPITVLHVRGDDGGCGVRLFDALGVEIANFDMEDVDAGRGYDAEDWQARIDAARALPDTPFRAALLEALGDPPNAEHIHGRDDHKEEAN